MNGPFARRAGTALLLSGALAAALPACGRSGGSGSGDPAGRLYDLGLADWNAAQARVKDARALLAADPVGNATIARSELDLAVAGYQAAQGWFDQLTTTYPSSSFHDAAVYYGGRSSYEVGVHVAPPAPGTWFGDARQRLDPLAFGVPSSSFADRAAYFEGRSRFHLAALPSPLDGYPGARVDFLRSLALNTAGAYADNSQYYVGRTWYEQGYGGARSLPAGAAQDPAFAATVQAIQDQLATARSELQKVASAYPLSSYLDNARLYTGLAWYHEPEPISSVRIANLRGAVAAFSSAIGTAGSTVVPSARHYRGHSHYDLAFQLATPGSAKDQAEISAAIADFEAVPPPSVHADAALYMLAKSHVWHDPDGAGSATPPDCAGARAACAALDTLVNAPGSAYAASTRPASCATYITTVQAPNTTACQYP